MENGKLEELANKSAQKSSGGTPAHYISANQALRDDLCGFIKRELSAVLQVATNLQKQLTECQDELKASAEREKALIERLDKLEGKHNGSVRKVNDKPVAKPDSKEVYLIGSSILRDVRAGDIINGQVKSIPGGKIKDVSEDIRKLTHRPKTVVIQIGGNDICSENATVDNVSTEYVALLTEVKDKLPDSKVIVSGLPPRFPSEAVRTKVKDLNESMKKWTSENHIPFVNNEDPFELKSGAVDCSAFVMTGATPCIHLNRKGTVRLLENLNKNVPDVLLSDLLGATHATFADALRDHNGQPGGVTGARRTGRTGGTNQASRGSTGRPRGCYLCGEPNHIASSCRHGRQLECFYCWRAGHKWQHCGHRPRDWRPSEDVYSNHWGNRYSRDGGR